jgi:capsular polysaccharide transport system permease protein
MKLWLKNHPYWLLCFSVILVVVFYWGFIATNRYVSETNVVMESPSIAPVSFSFSSILSGGSGSKDLLLLRDHLLSVDMLKKVDAQLNLKEHYSDNKIDFISRLDFNSPIEEFHKYYIKRIHVTMDDYAQVLRIQVHAFDPDMAKAIASLLLEAGEAHMNNMGQRLAAEQVKFIELQVSALGERLADARDALLVYQNQHGLISPTSTVESLSSVVAALDAELSSKSTQKSVLLNFQSAKSPDIIRLNNEIKALTDQIDQEKSRMAAGKGGALNTITAEYETLELQARFALDLYSNALAALENTRVESVRKLKQISVLQAPTQPEYAVEPRRLYNIVTFILMAMLITMIIQLLDTVIREHKD